MCRSYRGPVPLDPSGRAFGSSKTWKTPAQSASAGECFLGFLFSFSKGKLPGYLLPLLPAIAILLAVALNKSRPLRLVARDLRAAADASRPRRDPSPSSLTRGPSTIHHYLE